MQSIPASPEIQTKLAVALGRCAMFQGMDESVLRTAASQAALVKAGAGEALTKEGETPDAFFVLLEGKASAFIRRPGRSDEAEVASLGPGDAFGEIALLLGEPFGATVKAQVPSVVARFPAAFFQSMAERLPGFGLVLAKATAKRLQQAIRQVPLPEHSDAEGTPGAEVLQLLPLEFMQRHRVLPLKAEGNLITLGFVDGSSAPVLESVRTMIPGAELRPVRISATLLDAGLFSRAGASGGIRAAAATGQPAGAPMSLEHLLRTMITEGASDLHLSALHRPRWRIDGQISEVPGAQALGSDSVFEMIAPLIEERWSKQFLDTKDVDFSYSLDESARFRVNMFRDSRGASAVFRYIPTRIPDLATLGMPEVVARLCAEPKGLVLVTGPTGSGKSTTLAAMVDFINRTRKEHVLTLEDPVEFVHASQLALVNQREIGSNTESFARALRAGLREDPDVVLVGEMRDLETVALALETANTGHLVLATLHTSTAASTIDRIVGMFPPAEQSQIRTTLADVLRGVICQNLCRKIGGGRVAALEIMIVNAAVSNLIREAKTVQIASIMQTGKAAGNQMLSDSLASLVTSGKVERDEAMSKAVDKAELAKRLGAPQ